MSQASVLRTPFCDVEGQCRAPPGRIKPLCICKPASCGPSLPGRPCPGREGEGGVRVTRAAPITSNRAVSLPLGPFLKLSFS